MIPEGLRIFDNQRSFGRSQRRRIKEAAGFTCCMCGKTFKEKELEIHHDHIHKADAKRHDIPGSFVAHPYNGKPICFSCHDKLHDTEAERTDDIVIEGIRAIARLSHQGELARRVIAQISNRHRY